MRRARPRRSPPARRRRSTAAPLPACCTRPSRSGTGGGSAGASSTSGGTTQKERGRGRERAHHALERGLEIRHAQVDELRQLLSQVAVESLEDLARLLLLVLGLWRMDRVSAAHQRAGGRETRDVPPAARSARRWPSRRASWTWSEPHRSRGAAGRSKRVSECAAQHEERTEEEWERTFF